MSTGLFGPLVTITAGVVQSSTMTVPYGVDMTNLLASVPGGGTISSPSTTLTDQRSNRPVVLADSPTVSGNVVTQIIRGTVLTADHQYLLAVTFTAAANTVLTTYTTITVPA